MARPRGIGKLFLLLVSSLIALGLCEGIIRSFRLVPPVHAIWINDEKSFYRRSANPVLGHEIKPDFRFDFSIGTATSNSHGLRGPERPVAKPAGTRRIVVLGDSVVEGINYVPDDATIPRQLESLFADGRTEAFNLGTSGYCTLAEVELLKDKGLQFSPDVAIVIFTNNDFENFNAEHTTDYGVIKRPAWSKHLFVNSHFFRLLCLKLNWFEFAAESDPERRNQNAIGENNVVDGLRILRELANEHGFQVIIAVWPVFTDKGIVDFTVDGDQHLVITRLAAMNNLPLFKLSGAFNRDWEAAGKTVNPRKQYNARADGMHPNAEGGRVTAEALKTLIENSLPSPPYAALPPDEEAIELARFVGTTTSHKLPLVADRIHSTLLRQARFEDAETYLRSVIGKNPGDVSTLYYLAEHLFSDGRAAEAASLLNEALRIDPDHVDSRVSLARAHLELLDPDAAHEVIRSGLQRQPDSAKLQFAMAFVFAKRGDFSAAETHLLKVLTLDPAFPGARGMLQKVRQQKPTPTNAPLAP